MTTFPRRYLVRAAAVLLAATIAGCESSDVVAPDGATISLNANPATIFTVGGVQSSPVTIIATVSNSIGVPLAGQDVRFTTTTGILTPTAGLPISTDSFGNATTVLKGATQQATITAKSGKATSPSLTLQTASCALSTISLSPGPLQLDTCNATFDLVAVARDTSGALCQGILISFAFAGTASATDVSGTFNPVSDTTDTTGKATTTLTIASADCNTKCVGKTCTGAVQATSGSVASTAVQINDNVP
jgi:hypothetical protein